jgi:LysM repeat protein
LYTVRRGDTLYGIARKHGISVEALRRLNNLKKGRDIYPDQKIIVAP